MKYFILGSNSFAGSSLIDHLLTLEKEVIGISRSSEPNAILLAYANNKNSSLFQFYQMDINHDLNDITHLIKKIKPQVIVDFAGQGMVAESWDSPWEWYETNIVAKSRLHHFLNQCDFLEKYIRISTPEVYGHVDDLMTVNKPYHPSTPYAVSHAAIDMSLMAYYEQYQFPVVLTRFANFYGPHQQLYRIIPKTIISAMTNQKLPLHGGGTSKRAFIYHTDVASAISAVIDQGEIGKLYHFSGDQCISIADLVQKICSMLSVDYASLIEIVADRPAKDAQYALDDSESKKVLNWSPETTLEQGLAETIQWVKDNFPIIKTLPLKYKHKA